MHVLSMDAAAGDFVAPELRAYVVGFMEYQPGWGTTMPPPIRRDPSTWRCIGEWKDVQELSLVPAVLGLDVLARGRYHPERAE